MVRYFKRWMAYLLVPAGMVLLFVPVCTHHMGEEDRDVLFLEYTETLPDAEAIHAHGYPRIRSGDLASYPALSDAIRTLQQIWAYIPPGHHQQDAVPIEEWHAFSRATGISEDAPGFQFDRHVFNGNVLRRPVSVPIEVKNLKPGCKVTGGLCLILGLLALYGSYASPAGGGIRVGRRSAVILWDICIMGVGAVFTWWFVEFVLASLFQTATEWGEDFTVGMGVFWVALAYPALALITTAMSAQTVSITRESIAVKGLFGASTVKWSGVESIRVSQTQSPREIGGVPAPHRVMKLLVIEGEGRCLRVMEPPYASTKKEILAALLDHAPDAQKPRILIATKEWMSFP